MQASPGENERPLSSKEDAGSTLAEKNQLEKVQWEKRKLSKINIFNDAVTLIKHQVEKLQVYVAKQNAELERRLKEAPSMGRKSISNE